MKKQLTQILNILALLLLNTKSAYAANLPQPDTSLYNSAEFSPIKKLTNIILGTIFGISVLCSVVLVAWHGIRIQTAGANLEKQNKAKEGLKNTIIGMAITFASIVIITSILYVFGLIGFNQTGI